MTITLNDLDGQYEVHSESTYKGSMPLQGDGKTTIKNGLTYRKDKSGCTWESSFSMLEDGKVQIESTIDPSGAAENFHILDEKGNPTREIVTYRSVLEVRRINGKIVMSGTIQHGQDLSRLTMTQI